jgi:hypothetical protein
VFQKSYTRNILRIRRNKSQSSYFSWHETKSKDETEGHQRAAAPCHGAGHPLATPGSGVGPWPTPLWRPSTYIFPLTGKPKRPDQFFTKPTISHRRRRCEIGRVQKLFPAPCGEGNHRRRPSSSPWSPPEWYVSSLPWTTGP